MERPPVPFRWGILGAGRIAGKWARDLRLVPGARLQAAWARDPANLEAFVAAHGAERAASSIRDLLGRGDLDAVYVASPHGCHRDHVLACLEAGVPVLCEKAFALDATQAEEMVDAARTRDLFLMEALWTRFLPGFRAALDVARSGRIGRILSVRADFGFHAPYDPASRLWDPSMGGGALLDIGLYPIFLACSFLGPVDSFEVEWVGAPNGVDRDLRLRARHRIGRSDLRATFDEPTPCRALVEAEGGSLEFGEHFHTPVDILVRTGSGSEVVGGPGTGGGYQHEIAHVQECLASGLAESPLRPLEDTLALTELLDRIRLAMRSTPPLDARSRPG